MEQEEVIEPDFSGQVIDRYMLIRQLAVGGMGAVYEAKHTGLGKRVALKLLRQEYTTQDIARKRFLREARAVTAIKHPNVVDVSDCGETPARRVFFVMELLEGRDLRELLEEETRLPWSRARRILLQITSALAAAHSAGIVHRDIKPSNCFLVSYGTSRSEDFVKLLDFGIAKFSTSPTGDTEGLTSTDEVFGTVAYMAPEVPMGVTDDPRSDIYSVGIMMYRMLVGDVPFTGGTAFQVLSKHINEPPPPPRTREPSIPEEVETVILKMLSKEPDDRFQTMEEVEAAIRGIDERLGVATPTMATARVETRYIGVVEVLHQEGNPPTHPSTTDESVPSRTEHHPERIEQLGAVKDYPKRPSVVTYLGIAIALVLLIVGSIALGAHLVGLNTQQGLAAAASPSESVPLAPPAPQKALFEAHSHNPPSHLGTRDISKPSDVPGTELQEPNTAAALVDIEAQSKEQSPEESNGPTPSSSTPRTIGSDASVKKTLERKAGKCVGESQERIRIEALISTSGMITTTPFISGASDGEASCIKNVLAKARFRSGGLRDFTVTLFPANSAGDSK